MVNSPVSYSSHHPNHGWGIARKDPKFRLEYGEGGLIHTGRIISLDGKHVLSRTGPGNTWQGVKR